MLVVLLASPLLQERIGPVGWVAIIGGFLGVLLIVRPGSGLDMLGVLFSLFAAVANATYQIMSRLLAGTEAAITLLFYTALVGSACYGLSLLRFWETEIPDRLEIILFLSMGVAGGLGHYCFTLAFQFAPASLLAPVNYLQLIWAALLGWLVFGNTPDFWSLLGMLLIAACGILVALKSRK
jgi:drug/metabolite transporter (DMT)-like permease